MRARKLTLINPTIWPTDPIQVSLTVSILFSVKDPIQDPADHLVVMSYSGRVLQCLPLTLILLKSTGHLFCIRSLTFGLFDVFLWFNSDYKPLKLQHPMLGLCSPAIDAYLVWFHLMTLRLNFWGREEGKTLVLIRVTWTQLKKKNPPFFQSLMKLTVTMWFSSDQWNAERRIIWKFCRGGILFFDYSFCCWSGIGMWWLDLQVPYLTMKTSPNEKWWFPA